MELGDPVHQNSKEQGSLTGRMQRGCAQHAYGWGGPKDVRNSMCIFRFFFFSLIFVMLILLHIHMRL